MLFVDLWQSPILGFTHYETCLINKYIIKNIKTQESMTENKALEKESQL